MIHTSRIKKQVNTQSPAVKQPITVDRSVLVNEILNKLYQENLGNKFHQDPTTSDAIDYFLEISRLPSTI